MENLNVTVHRLIKRLLFVQSNVYKDFQQNKSVLYDIIKLKRQSPKRWLIITIINCSETSVLLERQ